MNPWPLVASCIMICSQRLSSGNQLFSQDVRRTRTTNVASHVLGSGKGNRQGARHVEQEDARIRLPLTWAMLSHGRRVVASRADGEYLFCLGLALACFLLCRAARVVGIRGRPGPPRLLSNAEQPHFPSRRNTNCIREQIGRLGIAGTSFGVEGWPKESKAHHHANSARKREGDGGRVDGILRSSG